MKDLVTLRVDERLKAITEAQADQVLAVIEGVLDDLNLTTTSRCWPGMRAPPSSGCRPVRSHPRGLWRRHSCAPRRWMVVPRHAPENASVQTLRLALMKAGEGDRGPIS